MAGRRGGNSKIAGFKHPDVGKSVMAGPSEAVRVRAGLEQARLLRLRAEASILGDFVENVERLRSGAHGQAAAWSQKRSRTWLHGGHCLSWSGGNVAGPFGVRSASERRWALPTSSCHWDLMKFEGDLVSLGGSLHQGSSVCVCVRRTGWTSGWGCVSRSLVATYRPHGCCGGIGG